MWPVKPTKTGKEKKRKRKKKYFPTKCRVTEPEAHDLTYLYSQIPPRDPTFTFRRFVSEERKICSFIHRFPPGKRPVYPIKYLEGTSTFRVYSGKCVLMIFLLSCMAYVAHSKHFCPPDP